ncbi:acyl-CoA thioesterase [Jatrophihabitans fulvus]
MWSSDYQLRLVDIDGLGHLTATSYLALFEETRAAWMLDALDMSYPTYALRTQKIEYLNEVRRMDGLVTVSLRIAHIGTSSIDLREELSAGGVVRATSTALLVMWDTERRCSRPIEPTERAVLERFRDGAGAKVWPPPVGCPRFVTPGSAPSPERRLRT